MSGGTVTTRSAIDADVYGSSGWASVGASETTARVAFGDGVDVTSLTNPPSVELTPRATIPTPPIPTYRTRAPRNTTAKARAIRM